MISAQLWTRLPTSPSGTRDLPLRDKRSVLQDVAHWAALAMNVADDIVFKAVLRREELGSTGVGNGVAIPHVRLGGGPARRRRFSRAAPP
jgi:nitrogen PTS system EIIA component